MRCILFITLLAGVLSSCESGVEIERIPLNKLIAISSFISPQDSVLCVHVYRGQEMGSILRPDSAVIREAQVTISDGIRMTAFTYNASRKCYTLSSQIADIQPEKEYRLQVKVGNTVCNASCRIPPNPVVPNVNQSKVNDDFIALFNWPSSEKNRYYIFNYSLRDIVFRSQIGNPIGPYIRTPTNTLFDRQDKEANEMEIRVINAFKADRVSLAVFYQAVDENTYKYLKTYQDFSNWQNNTDHLIPNLREPQPVFDNIEGGIGIFGGYNRLDTLFKIKG
ncbi:DUF4249 family protein [Runella slithyformis]|uniref:DUF4249 domain-containing protein n=1 Tax=Runella slithyformis (strain ATCC 29530 / DSM 19594 / LMG 11500 / NCIMB 11436 / LSU 4) TaxID=761193 RepID=A0A7U4E7L7_RUNSL|nr:DUF4249 family protein [Runella slithyformis]AEI50514.1 hypothetical protein Runsl_4170 [Runella slithyformis DSM 19594]